MSFFRACCAAALLSAIAAIYAQKLDPEAANKPAENAEKVKLAKPEDVTTDEKGSEVATSTAREALLPARKLKSDVDKEVDDLPFGVPQIDKRENVFGDKQDKDAILKRMEYQIGFIAEGAGFNNTDLRRLDESTVATIQNTDDKMTLAFSRFYVNMFFPLTDDLYFRVDIFKNGFWGHDQLGGSSSNNSSSSTPVGADPFNFGELHLHYVIFKNDRHDLSLKIGRQFFEIGGEVYDYFLKDYLDAVTFNYASSRLGGFRIMAFDAFQLGADPTLHANYVRFFSHDNQRVRYFDGDTNVLRAGFVWDSRNLLNWKGPLTGDLLQNKIYAFGARYGAVSRGGSDRSNLGASGNFADNDYNMMFGTRFLFNLPRKRYIIKTFADAAVSTGIDRRLPTAANESQDVDTNGYAFGGGGSFELPRVIPSLDLDLNADGMYVSGSKYNENGIQTSHGFTSFKGSRLGGIIMSRFYGVRPSSYTDSAGISDFPHDYERKAATAFAHLGVGTTLWQKLRFGLDYWLAVDTGSSALYAQARANGTTSSITSVVLKAQDRLGKVLGHEVNFSADFAVNRYWTLYFRAGVFLPGNFYSTPGVITDTPFGTDNAMGVQLGSKLIF
ncbi:MAG TPA: alginate export family protein [Turneriella sp.]|nr:alginate export family protein [Turneriella sp.]